MVKRSEIAAARVKVALARNAGAEVAPEIKALAEMNMAGPGVDRTEDLSWTYTYSGVLGKALEEAAAAHHEHEQGLGHPDADWVRWYADYMAEWFVQNDFRIEEE